MNPATLLSCCLRGAWPGPLCRSGPYPNHWALPHVDHPSGCPPPRQMRRQRVHRPWSCRSPGPPVREAADRQHIPGQLASNIYSRQTMNACTGCGLVDGNVAEWPGIVYLVIIMSKICALCACKLCFISSDVYMLMTVRILFYTPLYRMGARAAAITRVMYF